MSANENGIASNDTRPMPASASLSSYGSLRPRHTQSLALYVIMAAGTIPTLLVLHSTFSQMGPLQADGLGRAITAAGLAGILAGMFSYTAIRLFDLLTNTSLYQILAGDELPSVPWGALALLGITIGGAVALFHKLAIAVLPLLPAYLVL